MMTIAAEVQARVQASFHGRYTIDREIGAGGMGLVFLATDIRHNRRVAIKVLRPDLMGSVKSSRFLSEIMTVARFTHPGIVPIHDSGEADGLLYYVMPYMEEGSLRDLLDREGQLPLDRAVAIASEVGQAMAYAHDLGVVHADLKPANILLEGGRPVVSDFGVAVALGGEGSRKSGSGVAIGTAAYMSPEQGTGRDPIDGRTDLHALGCILFEMIAGEPPVRGPSPQAIIARKSSGRVPPLRVIRPKVPRNIDRAVARALEPLPVDRFETIERFVEAVSTPRTRPRHRSILLAVAGMTAALATVALLGRSSIPIDPRLVVVDEFVNRTGDTDLDGIGIFVADWITHGLQATRLASVMPTPSALKASRFAKRQAVEEEGADPLALLARETGAGVIVSGSYYKEGDRLTFSVQLSDAAVSPWQFLLRTGVEVRLRAALDPVVVHQDSAHAVMEQVRARVMGALALADGRTDFTAPELFRIPPTYEAYHHFSAGMDAYIANDLPRAVEAFRDAFERDTTFVVALLHAALNASNLQQWAVEDSLLRTVEKSVDRLSPYHRLWLQYRQALLAADRPLALRTIRALSAEAPRTKATYNLAVEAWENGNLEEAEEALRSLTPEIGPVRDFLPYWGALATVLHLRGKYREALVASRRAIDAHPGMWWPVGWELGAMAALGQVENVLERAETMVGGRLDEMGRSPAEALREAAEELHAHGYADAARSVWMAALRWYRSVGRVSLGFQDRFGWAHTLYALGEYSEAGDLIEDLVAESPLEVRVLGLRATTAARQGDSTTAREVMDRLAANDLPFQFGSPVFQAAMVAAVLGDTASAFRSLRQARSEGRAYGHWVRREIDFEGLRELSTFKELTRPVPLGRDR